MPRSEHYRPSPDQGPTRRQPDVLARLEQAVGQIQDSESFRAYLDMQAHFHRYSPGNVALILAQRPDATRVAGYNAWLHMHRYAQKPTENDRVVRVRGAHARHHARRPLQARARRCDHGGGGPVTEISAADAASRFSR